MKKIVTINKKDRLLLDVTMGNQKEHKYVIIFSHGLNGTKEDETLVKLRDKFTQTEFLTITFDYRNGVGESDGKYERLSFKSMFSDLKSIIDYATREFPNSKLVLIGHSLGVAPILEWEAKQKQSDLLVLLSPVTYFSDILTRLNPQIELEQKIELYSAKFGKYLKLNKQFWITGQKWESSRFWEMIASKKLLVFHGDKDKNIPIEFSLKAFSNKINVIKNENHFFLHSTDLIYNVIIKRLTQ